MDGYMDGKIDGWMDGWMNICINVCMRNLHTYVRPCMRVSIGACVYVFLKLRNCHSEVRT